MKKRREIRLVFREILVGEGVRMGGRISMFIGWEGSNCREEVWKYLREKNEEGENLWRKVIGDWGYGYKERFGF